MICKKCGFEISEQDKFCQNCGSKIETVGERKKTDKKEYVKANEIKKNSNKKGLLIGAVVIIVLIIGTIIGFTPKEIELEVGELSKILMSEECKDYYGDTLYVHGYLVRNDDTSSLVSETNGYYSLTEKADSNSLNANIIVFKYQEKVGEDVGSGSEVIIKCEINETNGEIVINAESIEILEKEEMIRLIEIGDISNNFEKYKGENVSVFGRVVKRFEYGDSIVVDYSVQNAMEIKGMTDEEIANCISKGGYVTLTGTITTDTFNGIAGSNNEIIAIDVNDFVINEPANGEIFEYEEALTVDEIINLNWNDGEFITIEGLYIKDGTYSAPHSIADEDSWNYIVLNCSGFGIEIEKYCTPEEKCVVSGYLYKTGTGYRLDVAMIG